LRCGDGDLLLEISALARVEAQFRDGDGGHVHIVYLEDMAIGMAPFV
jgi:hypothetical protein